MSVTNESEHKRPPRRRTYDGAVPDRLPPHSPEAEQGVIGCILLSPSECVEQCLAKLKAGTDVFYDLRHQAIFDTVVKMVDEQKPVDLITVSQRLKDAGTLEQVGGLSYLMTLSNTVPSAANLACYLEIVREKHTLRRILQTCNGVSARIYEHDGELTQLVDEFERDVLAIGAALSDAADAVNLRAIQEQLIAEYEAAIASGAPMGLPTGFADLDHRCGGMQGKELIILAGEPSAGKTAFTQNIAARAAAAGTTVAFYSVETSAKKLVHRWQCMLGRVAGAGFNEGRVSEDEVRKMADGQSKLGLIRDRLIVHDDPLSVGQLVAKARADWKRGARLFVLDYLQLLEAPGDGETERITNASKACKRIAQELDVPFIVISSLSRMEKGAKRRPKISDLRGSGQIDFDANRVILLSCESDDDVRTVTVEVAKNKDGGKATGTRAVELTFFAPEFRMEDAAR